MEAEQKQVTDLFDLSWFPSSKESSLWFRAYNLFGMPAEMVGKLNKIYPCNLKIDGRPIWLKFLCTTAPVSLTKFYFEKSNLEDGMISIVFKDTAPLVLPPSSYCFVVTPFNINGKHGSEPEAKRVLDISVGLLRSHFGQRFLFDLLYEEELCIETNGFKCRSGAIRLPQEIEGPYLSPINWLQCEEILLEIQKSPAAKRLYQAIEYINHGFSESDFISYWIALELICNSHQEKVFCTKLAQTYEAEFSDFKNGNRLGFKTLLKKRQEFFHKGVKFNLLPAPERLIQLLLLDLLRNELSLPPLKHAEALLKMDSLDLSSLNLTPPLPAPEMPAQPSSVDEETRQKNGEAFKEAYAKALEEYKKQSDELWPPKESKGVASIRA